MGHLAPFLCYWWSRRQERFLPSLPFTTSGTNQSTVALGLPPPQIIRASKQCLPVICVCLKCISEDPGVLAAEDASAAAHYYHPRHEIIFIFPANFSFVLPPLHPSSSEKAALACTLWLRVIKILPLSVSANLPYRSAELKSPSFPIG